MKISKKPVAEALRNTVLLTLSLFGCEPTTVQPRQEEPSKPGLVQAAAEPGVSAPVQAALKRLTSHLLPESKCSVVEEILATVDPSEQLEYLAIAELVLADKSYRDVTAEQRVQTMGLLAMSRQSTRPGVAATLTDVIPPTVPELREGVLTLAELAPSHQVAEALRLVGEMFAAQVESTQNLLLRRLLDGEERERKARMLQMLWLNQDGSDAQEAWGGPLGHLVTGALGLERLTSSLDRILALPPEDRWLAAKGLASLSWSVSDRAKAEKRLDVILNGTDAEFVLMTHDLAYLFPACDSVAAVDAFLQLKEEGQAWRLLAFTLRKYKADPDTLYALAALPEEEQMGCLDRAVRCYLDLGIPITAARLGAKSCTG